MTNERQMPGLKRCPFCGDEAKECRNMNGYWFSCENAACAINEVQPYRADAVKDWNTRSDLSEWRPIETAPKDGTNVLLWWPAQFHCALTGHWADKWNPWIGWKVTGWSHDKYQSMPTHWMPLPPHPKDDE